jgi:hypothetical protein
MNWIRGLLWVWAVVSIAWIAGVFVAVDPIPKLTDPIAAYAQTYRTADARAAGYSDEEIITRMALMGFGEWALIPPMALLALGLGGWWVRRGFKKEPLPAP